MGNVCAYLAARRSGRPVLVTQHIGAVPYRNPFLRWVHDALNRTVGRWLLRGADRVVFYSESARRYFSSFAGLSRRTATIPNGVDGRVFSPAGEASRRKIRARLGWPRNRPVCLFVGRFVEKKGLEALHSLAARMRHVQWAFAGWGPLDPRKWRLPNVRVYAGREGRSLAPLYQGADLLVLPSRGEGYPLVVQEAMSCGTPAMVATETARAYPPAASLVFSAKVGDAATVRRWQVRLEGILGRRGELLRRRTRVAAFARARWTWDGCAGRYLEILECLSRQRGSR
jgi:glycosyltransferase involved in cell wall biosynthesis